MKLAVLLCVLSVVGYSIAAAVNYEDSEGRGCRYILGRCVAICEKGTHAYATGCGYKTPEATCDEPNPRAEEHMICDYSSCYCDAPTVRDSTSGQCVALEDCPKKQ